MVTTAQLRAVLAVLRGDSQGAIGGQVADQRAEAAELIGLLYGTIGNELRKLIVEAPLGESTARWISAAAAAQSAAAGPERSEKAQFDARWLRHHVAALSYRDEPEAATSLLGAAAHALDAAATLLALARSPQGEGSATAWPRVLDDLAIAFQLVRDEWSASTDPIR
ncbi:hypothetical protein ACFU44_05760 [Nocardia rhizosphaerihabitans]|uniref:hypothetical protein n=1 Tax=Nocardia rhizosphaerihabitans TaxID=1691570 RepID=UPI00367264A1